MVSRYKYLWWCWVVLMLYWKKFEVRPLDPIPRVWGGRRGGRRGEVNNFSVMLGHPALYWASLPYFPTDHKSPNYQESMLRSWRIVLFQFIRYVLRFIYEIRVRNSYMYEYSRDSSEFGLSAESLRCTITLLIS